MKVLWMILILLLPAIAYGQTCTQADLNHPLSAVLNWQDNATGETGQVIERKQGSDAYSPLVTVGANITTYTDATVQRGVPGAPDNTYFYRLKAIAVQPTGPTLESAYSNESCITFKSPPMPPPMINLLPPSGLTTASISSSTIRTSWEDIDGETAYEVEGKRANVKQWTRLASVLANVTTYDYTGLLRYKTYCLRVRGLAGITAGPYSDMRCATTSK